MPDFIANLGQEQRPKLRSSDAMRWIPIGSGWIGINKSRWNLIGDKWFIAGRPSKRGGGQLDPHAMDDLLGARASEAFNRISGMFVAIHTGVDCLTVITDRFNHLPAYSFTQGSLCYVSSHVEWIASAAPDTPPIDDVSVAELMLYENVTFPHTTRLGVQQLAPGTRHRFSATGDAETDTLWQPKEPDRWPTKKSCIDAAVHAFEDASAEIASSATSAGVLLSGGLDSRLILAGLAPRMHTEAFTFLDRPNRESRAAAAAARTIGVPHHEVRRDPEFYAGVFDFAQREVGFEQHSVPCHGACLSGVAAAEQMDLLVSGFGCDILLKGAYIPYGLDTLLKKKFRLGGRNAARIGKHNYSNFQKRRELIRPSLVEAAVQRRDTHESWIRGFRPSTAEEWLGFYPISHTTSIDTILCARLFGYDEFFFHAAFVDAMCVTPWDLKKNLVLVGELGKRVGGPAARLAHPDSGLPATATYTSRRVLKKLGVAKEPPAVGGSPEDPSWYSEASFINYRAFYTDSPAWTSIRKRAFADNAAVDALSRIMRTDPHDLAEMNDGLDSLIHGTVVQALRIYARNDTPELP